MALWSVVSLFQWFTLLFGPERCVFVRVCVRVNFSRELQSASVAVTAEWHCNQTVPSSFALFSYTAPPLSHKQGSPANILIREAEEKYHMAALIRAPVHGEHLDARSNKLAGVGIRLDSLVHQGRDSVRVRGVLRNSPADKCGWIRANDELVLVDQVNVEGKGVDEIVHLILGPEGTECCILLRRDSRKYIKVPPLVRQFSHHQSDTVDLLRHAQCVKRLADAPFHRPRVQGWEYVQAGPTGY